MAIPDYETLMLPVLQYIADGKEYPLRQITAHMAEQFKLTAEERQQRIPSGSTTYIQGRTGWAKTYLKKAGLLALPKRGVVQITERGLEVLKQKPSRLDNDFLSQFPEFVAFKSSSDRQEETVSTDTSAPERQTPEEAIERSYNELRSQLADELLEQIKACSSDFFERLVVDVIVAMGYGGSQRDAARAKQAWCTGAPPRIKQLKIDW